MLALKRNIARRVVLDFNQSIAERIGEKRTQEFLETVEDIRAVIVELKGS